MKLIKLLLLCLPSISLVSCNPNNTLYTAVGDSITYGYLPGTRMANPYPNQVKKLCNFSAVFNQGISGSTLCTSGDNPCMPMCLRINNISKQSKYISILGGVNDYQSNAPLGDISSTDNNNVYGALNNIANILSNDYKNSNIVFMTPMPCVGYLSPNSQGYKLIDVRNAVIAVAEKKNFKVLDLYTVSKFEDYFYSPGCDGLHPTQEFVTNNLSPLIANFFKNNF